MPPIFIVLLAQQCTFQTQNHEHLKWKPAFPCWIAQFLKFKFLKSLMEFLHMVEMEGGYLATRS